MKSKYEIVNETKGYILIRDIGHSDGYMTITNNAEAVVEELADNLNGRKLFYYDSDNKISELMIKNKRFYGFREPNIIREM